MPGPFRNAIHRYIAALSRRSAAIAPALHRRAGTIATVWMAAFLFASIPRIVTPAAPVANLADVLGIVLPYLLIAYAPVAGYRLATRCFAGGVASAQLATRLSFYGKWRRLSLPDAQKDPIYGPAGLMASMLIGLLLNVVLRSFEFLLAVPALGSLAPDWGQALFQLMAADVAVMSFFYMVCFVMALRNVPLFPRMLVFVWSLDILAQLVLANSLGSIHGLPRPVGQALDSLLFGNIQKVLISALVWLPYLILSDRVNVTYRLRRRNSHTI
jgi:hypothetical protein